MTTKAITKTTMPSAAKITAFTTLLTTGAILFASGVMMVVAVDGTVRAGIVAHRAGNVFDFVDRCQAPSVVLGGSEHPKHKHPVEHVQDADHEPPPISGA